MRVRSRSPLNLSAPVETDAAPDVQTEGAAPEADRALEAEPAPEPEAEAKADDAPPTRKSERQRAPLSSRTRVSGVQYRTRLSDEAKAAPAAQASNPEPAAEARPQPRADRPGRTRAEPEIPAPAPEALAAEPAAPPAPETVAAPAARAERRPARFAYFFAALATAVWVAGVTAFVIGYQGGFRAFDYTPFHTAVLVLLAIAPVGLIFVMAYIARQAARLAGETRRAATLSEAMVAPAALASGQTADLVRQMRAEIEEATAASARAREELSALKDALAQQTRELTQAAEHANRTAKGLEQSLGRERDEMSRLAAGLEQQALGVVEAVERQTRATAEVSDLAQAQLREAEAALTARAADLAAAAGEAQDAARLAADDLARQTIRLETAGTGVAEQIRSVEEGLSQQRAALVAAGYTLRTDQEDFSAQVETQRAQLAEALSHTRMAVGELNEASARGAEMLSGLVVDAAEQAKAFADLSTLEREAFETRIRETLDRFAEMAAEARDDLTAETSQALVSLTTAAEDARKAADAAADAAQARIDNLGEAAFDASRRADEAFDARLAAAKRLFEESSHLIDEAGERAAARLEANMADVRSALTQIQMGLAEMDGRTARLPEEARERIDQIRAAVEDGLESLSAAARKAAEETQAVDAAFQDRVKRNYDMLSEAVKLMGLVSGGSPQPRPRLEPEAEQRRRPQPAAAPEEPAPSEDGGLRGRLKLTPPAASEEEFRDAFESATARGDREGWTWRDLLGSMEAAAADTAEKVDDEELADRLIADIHRLGVDPNALLPRSRVEAAADAYQAGAPDSARDIVRRVAPAAARRISRAVITDKAMREQSERFLALYESRVAEAVRRDPDGGMVNALLASEPGRAFLLIDAAIGDLG